MSAEAGNFSPMQELIATLDLEKLEENLFRGTSPQVGWQRVFGGQVIAQALVAAQRTVDEGRFVHSLHAYFMRPGDPSIPIIYEVDRIRDGKSFTTRRVVAVQHGKAIFSLSASFQEDEDGFEHQQTMPAVPTPEELGGEGDIVSRYVENAPEAIRRYWLRPARSNSAPPIRKTISSASSLSRCRTSGCAPPAPRRTTAACGRPSLPISRT